MKNDLDNKFRVTLLSLLLIGIFTFAFNFDFQGKAEEPTTDVTQIYELPKIDIVIEDFTLGVASAHYIVQLKKTGKLSTKYLSYMKNQRRQPSLNLFIDTYGGSFDTGMMIMNSIFSLRKMGFNIKCYAVKAHSMGFSILQTCTDRIILNGGNLAVHNIHGGTKYTNRLADIERARFETYNTGKTVKQLVDMRSKDIKYFTAEEALKDGLVDEIL